MWLSRSGMAFVRRLGCRGGCVGGALARDGGGVFRVGGAVGGDSGLDQIGLGGWLVVGGLVGVVPKVCRRGRCVAIGCGLGWWPPGVRWDRDDRSVWGVRKGQPWRVASGSESVGPRGRRVKWARAWPGLLVSGCRGSGGVVFGIRRSPLHMRIRRVVHGRSP